jgi:RNA 2',3'-cyclic 3'-phosphodiesterase
VTSTGSVGGDEYLRLFCALRLPEDTLDAIEHWQGEQLAAGDWRLVGRDNLHATLAFLGRRPASDLPAVAGALREAAAGAGEIVLSPRRYRETRSVGMLVLDDEAGEGGRFADRLAEGLERLGVYEREERAWLPHVTVIRFRERPRLRPALPELEPFAPSDAAVYMSSLRRSGADYAVLEAVSLGG